MPGREPELTALDDCKGEGHATRCLLVRNNLPERVVHCLCRAELRPKVFVDRHERARIALDVMSATWTTPEPLIIDLRHLIQGLLAWFSRLLHSVVVRVTLRHGH